MGEKWAKLAGTSCGTEHKLSWLRGRQQVGVLEEMHEEAVPSREVTCDQGQLEGVKEWKGRECG